MIYFKRFNGSHCAIFEINGREVAYDKTQVLRLHESNKKKSSPKGTTPDIEQTKCTLDRWPGTALSKRIQQLKK